MNGPVRPLLADWRTHAPALLQAVDDPHDEVLALVWGPRFDRAHALELLMRQESLLPAALSGVMTVADQYDALGHRAQRRLRQLILRHRASHRTRVHATMSAPCTASC